MSHPVVWFEVLGKDGEKLQRFYGELFNWKLQIDNPLDYAMVDTGAGRGIPGGVGPVFQGTRSWVTFYVETPDIDASLARAEKLGGKTLLPRKTMANTTLAFFEDPEGHVIGLVEPMKNA
jgi:predicted enzyme related to lactoylglutathione lyase